MADINKLVPFILYYEAGVGRYALTKSNEEIFALAKKTGFANDPDDRGGATMCGITLNTYTEYCRLRGQIKPTVASLKAITYNHWLDVLKTLYWDKWKADKIESQPLAEILVDWVWASGVNGIKIPQKIVGVAVDGVVGPKTLEAVNKATEPALFTQIKNARINFVEAIAMRDPRQKKFLRGWKRRIDAICYDGLKYN